MDIKPPIRPDMPPSYRHYPPESTLNKEWWMKFGVSGTYAAPKEEFFQLFDEINRDLYTNLLGYLPIVRRVGYYPRVSIKYNTAHELWEAHAERWFIREVKSIN